MIALARGAALLACCLVLGCSATERSTSPQQPASGFVFAAMGDTPYNADEEAQFIATLAELNRERLAFVVHVGDFKSGQSECSDEVFHQRREWFALSHHPFVFVPGDNDWTDCWRSSAGAFQPTERLGRLRELFFAQPRSQGQRSMHLVQQTNGASPRPYPEHLRWINRGVLFLMSGGDNNLARERQFHARDSRCVAGSRKPFGLRAQQRRRVIMVQAILTTAGAPPTTHCWSG
jgi:hypothetical protein